MTPPALLSMYHKLEYLTSYHLLETMRKSDTVKRVFVEEMTVTGDPVPSAVTETTKTEKEITETLGTLETVVETTETRDVTEKETETAEETTKTDAEMTDTETPGETETTRTRRETETVEEKEKETVSLWVKEMKKASRSWTFRK